LFIDYLHLLPDLTQRAYGDIGLIRLLGADACIPLAILISIWIAIRWRETEVSYMACIAVTVLGTALWFHAYTPLILPAESSRPSHSALEDSLPPPNPPLNRKPSSRSQIIVDTDT
jgi:hypothetical protein